MSTSLDYHFLKYKSHSKLGEYSDVNKKLYKASHLINSKQIMKTKFYFVKWCVLYYLDKRFYKPNTSFFLISIIN